MAKIENGFDNFTIGGSLILVLVAIALLIIVILAKVLSLKPFHVVGKKLDAFVDKHFGKAR